jgi:hypothetical protein
MITQTEKENIINALRRLIKEHRPWGVAGFTVDDVAWACKRSDIDEVTKVLNALVESRDVMICGYDKTRRADYYAPTKKDESRAYDDQHLELVSAEELTMRLFDESSRPRPSTVKKWGRQGILPSLRIGKKRYFPLRECAEVVVGMIFKKEMVKKIMEGQA